MKQLLITLRSRAVNPTEAVVEELALVLAMPVDVLEGVEVVVGEPVLEGFEVPVVLPVAVPAVLPTVPADVPVDVPVEVPVAVPVGLGRVCCEVA
jgi:hypothetical protein